MRRLNQEPEGLVVRVPNSFWPRFFGLVMVVRFVDSAIAFCAAPAQRFFHNNGKKRRISETVQFVFLYPESGDAIPFVPTESLFEEFPAEARGELVIPNKLPFPYNQIRHVTGVRIYELEQGKRRMFCAVPTWESRAQILLADARLDCCVLDSPFSLEELKRKDYQILTSVEKRGLFYNITLVGDNFSATPEDDVNRRAVDEKAKLPVVKLKAKKIWSN